MRRIFSVIAVVAAMTASAQADIVEGKIKKIDADNYVITLDDGKSYKLPGEFDISAIENNMEVLIAYDAVNGENHITDMELSE